MPYIVLLWLFLLLKPFLSLQYSIPTSQVTVPQKPHQGTSGKHAVYCFPVAFFVTFFSTKKSKEVKTTRLNIAILLHN
jgi:hypothetical protein